MLMTVVVALRGFRDLAAMVRQKAWHVLELNRGVMNAERTQHIV
jgi:hypothetical protein